MKTIVFNTKRLSIGQMSLEDKAQFIELLSDPKILKLIPQKAFKLDEIMLKFNSFLNNPINVKDSPKSIWGVYELHKKELIGICGLLTNDEKDRELAYRLRHKYWNKGYGSEIAKGLIDYSFETLSLTKITADVNVENTASVKILEKYLVPYREFYNEKDKCTDRRYVLELKAKVI